MAQGSWRTRAICGKLSAGGGLGVGRRKKTHGRYVDGPESVVKRSTCSAEKFESSLLACLQGYLVRGPQRHDHYHPPSWSVTETVQSPSGPIPPGMKELSPQLVTVSVGGSTQLTVPSGNFSLPKRICHALGHVPFPFWEVQSVMCSWDFPLAGQAQKETRSLLVVCH